MQKPFSQIAVIVIAVVFLGFILNTLLSQNKTITSGVKNSCNCVKQGYASGIKGGEKNLYGCYKGTDGRYDIRRAWNEGYWYGQKSSNGYNMTMDYNSAINKYCK